MVRLFQKLQQQHFTHSPLKVYKAQPLTYIKADDDEIWLKGLPVLRTRGVIKLEPVFGYPRTNLEDERLVYISKKGDGDTARELISSLADPPGLGSDTN